MSVSVRTFIKTICEMNEGDIIYLNTINFTPKATDKFRSYIITGVLEPSIDDIEKAIYPDFWCDFIRGNKILPQCHYYKRKQP